MASTTTSSLLRAARPAFRPNTFYASQATRAFRPRFQQQGRRWQSTAAPDAAAGQSWFKRMWDSPIGLKTVHFWAPVMKWCIVLAGVSDFYRPAEKLSLAQNASLTATGAIWTRWCLIIKPRNILLATVNFFLGVVGVIQVSRIMMYRNSAEGKAALELEAAKSSVAEKAGEIKGKVVDVVKKA
ncbi:hypothetical protein HYFRA_00011976 [Hymenoscyphus fraxineus]|uniref:Mitochondrial pyruvate carrier n=1 Tax=Hymenoscyphus fraxineus TaxID=746836 RepID=A0A9N9L3J4_9HELO|nr:hypothetical protein HYFRA_00011976 [Hymenoscyphus fraxineus]